MSFRTDNNNNPTAFTTEVAKNGGLRLNLDYAFGDLFTIEGHTYYTAKLLHNPIDLTIQLIDKIGFRTSHGARWTYINMPKFLWDSLDRTMKVRIIADMYQNEGGITMKGLFS